MQISKNKVASKRNSNLNFLIISAFLITLALTPWVNSDSLIIPKGIILFCAAAFLIPKLVMNYRTLISLPGYKLIFWISLFFLLQMILVLVITDSPIAQQFYGRTGRALGFATYVSLIIFLLSTTVFTSFNSAQVVNLGLVLSCWVSSSYSIIQKYGYDVFDWVTATNGIIGTLGNPNFQSSFAAMAIVPSFLIFSGTRNKRIISFLLTSTLLYTLYISASTQGYIASAAAISVAALIYTWYRKKAFFVAYFLFFIVASSTALAGMLNRGPLNYYLYKNSVRSRGEMWDTAVTTIKANPIFGVGLDSFGDFSLLYRSEKTANGINEFIDNAHNLFLQFAISGGIILSVLYLGIVLLSLYSFFKIQRRLNSFDKNLTGIFAAWISFQLQSFISPANISMLVWNFILCGFLIGVAFNNFDQTLTKNVKVVSSTDYSKPFSYLLLIFALIIMYPWYNSDRLAWKEYQARNATGLMSATKMFPESSIRYSRVALELYKAKLFEQSLDIARSSVKFNPNSVQGWFLILANEKAPVEERRKAREKVFQLDPLNKEASNYNL
jgi:O-antigen ligase